jgi:hypothetical protein
MFLNQSTQQSLDISPSSRLTSSVASTPKWNNLMPPSNFMRQMNCPPPRLPMLCAPPPQPQVSMFLL